MISIDKKIFYKYFKLAVYILPLIVLIWLLNKHFAFTGKIQSDYGFGINPSIISELYPEERLSDAYKILKNKDIAQDVKSDTVYFDVNVPRMFKSAGVKLKYSAPEDSIIELGLQKGPNDTDFYFETVQNYYYNNLDEDWNRIIDEDLDLMLLQKGTLEDADNPESNYSYDFTNVKDFLDKIPKGKTTSYYKVDIYDYLRLEDYQASPQNITINTPIKGDHAMVTYIKNEDLHFELDITDVNKIFGEDLVRIDLMQGSKIIYTDLIEDDGNDSNDNKITKLDKYILHKPGLPEGLYKVKISASDDIVVNKIKTEQTYLIFEGSISFYENQNNINLLSSGSYLKINENKNESTNFSINGIKQNTSDESNNYYPLDNPYLNSINISPNLKLHGEYFVFSENQYFDPTFNIYKRPLQHISSTSEADYILMPYQDYTAPKKSGKDYINTISFDTSNAYYGSGPLKFVISIPSNDIITIKDISVVLKKDPIWQNFFPRLFNKLNAN